MIGLIITWNYSLCLNCLGVTFFSDKWFWMPVNATPCHPCVPDSSSCLIWDVMSENTDRLVILPMSLSHITHRHTHIHAHTVQWTDGWVRNKKKKQYCRHPRTFCCALSLSLSLFVYLLSFFSRMLIGFYGALKSAALLLLFHAKFKQELRKVCCFHRWEKGRESCFLTVWKKKNQVGRCKANRHYRNLKGFTI